MRNFFVQFKKETTKEEWDLFVQNFKCRDVNLEEKTLIVDIEKWYTLVHIDINLNVEYYKEIK